MMSPRASMFDPKSRYDGERNAGVRPNQDTPAMLQISAVTGPTAFDELSDDWASLIERVPNPRLSQTRAWCQDWWRALGAPIDGARLLILRFESEGRVVALLPLVEGEERRPLRVNFLRSFGVAAAFMRHSLIEENTWLIEEGREAEVLHALADYINARQSRWDAVAIRYQSQHAEQSQTLLGAALSGWKQAQIEIVKGSDIAALAPSWDLELKALSRSMRDNIPYYPKRVAKAGLDWSVEFITDPDEIQNLVPRLIELHKLRADSDKMFHHDDYLNGPAEEAFVRATLRSAAHNGSARMGVARVDGEVIAIQVYFDHGDELVVWYSGFDDRFRSFCPIFIIQTQAIRSAITRCLRKVNFLRTHRFWTLKWGAHAPEDTLIIRLVSKRPLSKARLAIHYAKHVVRTRGLKGLLGRKDPAARNSATATLAAP